MRKFKLLNVIKETYSDLVADRLIEAGFEEIVGDIKSENVKELSRDEVKARLDEAGIEYAKNAKKETLLEILEASKLGE